MQWFIDKQKEKILIIFGMKSFLQKSERIQSAIAESI